MGFFRRNMYAIACGLQDTQCGGCITRFKKPVECVDKQYDRLSRLQNFLLGNASLLFRKEMVALPCGPAALRRQARHAFSDFCEPRKLVAQVQYTRKLSSPWRIAWKVSDQLVFQSKSVARFEVMCGFNLHARHVYASRTVAFTAFAADA